MNDHAAKSLPARQRIDLYFTSTPWGRMLMCIHVHYNNQQTKVCKSVSRRSRKFTGVKGSSTVLLLPWEAATVIPYSVLLIIQHLCFCTTSCYSCSCWKVDVGFLMCAIISLHAVQMKPRRVLMCAQMSVSKNWKIPSLCLDQGLNHHHSALNQSKAVGQPSMNPHTTDLAA